MLETHPQLAVARYFISNAAEIDARRHTVKATMEGTERKREIWCASLSDGTRRTFPGSKRVEISLPCRLGAVGAKLADQFNLMAVIEKEGGKTSATILFLDDAPQAISIGNMLPTSIPNWMPDLSTASVEALQYSLSVNNRWATLGPNGIKKTLPGGYTLYVGFNTEQPPEQLVAAFGAKFQSLGAEKVDSDADSERWSNSEDGLYKNTIYLKWGKDANGKWVYEFFFLSVLDDALTKKVTLPQSKTKPTHSRPSAVKP